MKTLSFRHGVGIAAVLSLAGSVLYAALSPAMPTGVLLRALIALAGFSYLIYLLSHSEQGAGRVSAVGLWLAVAAANWFAAPPLLIYLLLHVGLIWLLRSLYFYSSAVSALLDLGLSGLSLAAASWAIAWSGSVLLAIWCFFLVQALFVSIPTSIRRGAANKSLSPGGDNKFQRARRDAEDALRRISASH